MASVWEKRKGLDDIIMLSHDLDKAYQIIVVGVNEKQKELLPDNIIGITRTNNTDELRKLYSMADVFLNPSKEESFGLTTIESMASGTQVIVYNLTAIPEVIEPGNGVIVNSTDKIDLTLIKSVNGYWNIDRVLNNGKRYDKILMIKEYIKIYE